nr:MAG TPA: hypothetical protein [Caudoviricetes sp.]
MIGCTFIIEQEWWHGKNKAQKTVVHIIGGR